MRLVLYYVLLVIGLDRSKAQESAQYLHNAIRDLRNMNIYQTLNRADTAAMAAAPQEVPDLDPITEYPPGESVTQPPIDKRIQSPIGAPPISLTKGELAALYQAAVSKGETVKLKTGDSSYVHAAVHEIDDSASYHHDHKTPPDDNGHSDGGGDEAGYYYYYYPIKSFLDEMTSQPSSSEYHYSSPHRHEVTYKTTTEKPHFQYHSHMHEHNVKILNKEPQEPKKEDNKKGLEPLFMAISGFIGMAVMFVLSVLFFPKLGTKKTLRGNIKKNERITDLARVALEAIEGKDCTERFACELERTARSFQMQDNRFMKLLRRMAPGTFGKQMVKVGKYNAKRLRCTAIPCKKKPAPTLPPHKKKPNAVAQKKH